MGLLKESSFLFLFLVFLLGCFPLLSYAQDCGDEFACQEALVKFSKSATPEEIQKVFSKFEATPLQYFDYARIYYLKLNSKEDTLSQIEELKAQNKVLVAAPNAKVTVDSLPNDPYFSNLWGLNNTGQFSSSGVGADIGMDEVWDFITNASSIVVAVIDTGVDYTHPDLASNMWVNTGEIAGNGIDDDHNGYIDDVYGYDFFNNDGDPYDDYLHGTHVAGTIGAVGNNGIGVSGVCQRTKIMAVKFLGSGGWGYYSGAISSIQYAVANGAKVLNNSWAGGSYDSGLASAVSAADSAGVIFVAAAGNSGCNTDSVCTNYPSSLTYGNVVSVAATTYSDGLASFSNYGAVSVDLGAPGSYIYSTMPTWYYSGSDDYAYLSGTSMATPHVAGAAALLWAANPTLTHRQIINLLLQGVTAKSYLNGKSVTGGLLNLGASLVLANSSLNHAPVANAGSTQYVKLGQKVTLQGSATDQDSNTNLTYAWTLTKPSGSSASLNSASAQKPTFKADVEGTYYGTLQVLDWVSTSVAASVKIEVRNDKIPPSVVIHAKKSEEQGSSEISGGSPVENGKKVVLDAQDSTDNNVSASESTSSLEYEWEFIEKPSGSSSSITDSNKVLAYFTPDKQGTYTVRLTINDGQNENSGEISFQASSSSASSGGGSGGCRLQNNHPSRFGFFSLLGMMFVSSSLWGMRLKVQKKT